MITSSHLRTTNANAMVSRTVEGIMDDDEYVSSSVKHSTRLLQVEKHDARVVPSIEEQLHNSD